MNDPHKNIALAVNSSAGGGRAIKLSGKIAAILKSKCIAYTICNREWPVNWEGYSEVWIVGGDGTLNYFINQYPQIELPLVLFPGGTGNDFHWLLYGETETETQIEKVLAGNIFVADAGICNDRYFINGIGIGFDGKIVKSLQSVKKLPGKFSYYVSILKNVFGFREQLYTINTISLTLTASCFMISIANGKRYGGGFTVAPDAELDDGYLELCIVKKIDPIQRIRYLPSMEKGRHMHLPFMTHRKAEAVRVSSPEIMLAHADGEYFSSFCFEISILPKAFRFYR